MLVGRLDGIELGGNETLIVGYKVGNWLGKFE